MTSTRARPSARSRSSCWSGRASRAGQRGDLRARLVAELLEAQRVDAVGLLAQDPGAPVDARVLGQLELELLIESERAVGMDAHAARPEVERAALDHLARPARQHAGDRDLRAPAATTIA